MNGSSQASPRAWEDAPSRNLLLPENLALVRQEFANHGVVFGWHYYYVGGRSGDLFCFSDYDSYYQELSKSRPGDHFTVYSLNSLATRALFRMGEAASTEPISRAGGFAAIENALAAGREVVFVWRHARPEVGRTQCDAGVLWDVTQQQLEQSLGLGSGRCGELLFFPVEMLDKDEQGVPIDSVSPGARRRVNAVVDGKRPDEAGLTPASGPY